MILKSNIKTAIIELAVFITIALVLKELMDPLSAHFAGPLSLITTIVLLTLYIRKRGQSWGTLGLRSLTGNKDKLLLIPQMLLIFITVLVVMVGLEKGLDAMGIHLLSEPIAGEKERWGNIEGNLRLYLILIALSWISAGFAEEMFFRGFIITRLETIFGDAKLAPVLIIVLAATFFGYVHFYYQGLAGFVNAGVIGLIFGTYFLLYKHNLWPLVLAHGCINTLGFTMEFLGMTA